MTDDQISEVEVDMYMALRILVPWLYRPEPWEWQVFDLWPQLPPGTQELFRRQYERIEYDLHVFGPTLAIIYNPRRPSRWQLIKRFINDTCRS